MNGLKITLSALFIGISAVAFAAADYGKGIVFINENQYGKGNGTLNHLSADGARGEWSYRIFRAENAGRELGGTPCDGVYHNGKLFIVSKFAKDYSASVAGGILTVMDGETLKWLGQIDQIDNSAGGRICGRSFIGINDEKGYLSSTDGVWVIDLMKMEVLQRIEGTENPNGIDNKPVGDPTAAIYFGQCGSMVLAAGKVFVAHQSKGLLVLDPVSDTMIETISMDCVQPDAGIGSVVKGHDGMLWLSVTANADGDGVMLNNLVKVDPATLKTEVINLPTGCYPPSSSWAAWTPDTFCASAKSDVLLWTGGTTSWFANQLVFKYDIMSGATSCLIDLEGDEDLWKVCCPSLRIDPSDDTIYMSLFKDVTSTQYMVRSYSLDGRLVSEYPMERGYWFPGQILFPASALAGVEDVSANRFVQDDLHVRYCNGVLAVEPIGEMTHAQRATVFDMSGCIMATFSIDGVTEIELPLAEGVYLLHVGSSTAKFCVH